MLTGDMYHLIMWLSYRIWIGLAIILFSIIIFFWPLGVLWFCAFWSLIITGILYHGQDLLLYFPYDPPQSRIVVLRPSNFNLPYKSYKIKGRDGFKVHMFLIKQNNDSKSLPTMIFFHGNKGNMGQRLHNISQIYHQLKVNILMVEYRGYGLSDGSPSELGFYKDAQTAFDFIMQRKDIDRNKIVLFGEALGGAVAIDLASRPEYRNKVWAVIVENTFTSLPDMANFTLKWKCLDWLPMICHKNKYMSIDKIAHVSSPTLFICGSDDLVVPNEMSSDLYEKSGAYMKTIEVMPGGEHYNTWHCRDYILCMEDFLNYISLLPGTIDVVTKAPTKRALDDIV